MTGYIQGKKSLEIHPPVFDSQNLAIEFWYFFKAVSVDDGVDQEEALASMHILFSHGTELLNDHNDRNIMSIAHWTPSQTHE